jgi:hypothetical protein
MGGFRHLGKSGQYLLFREVNVLECIVKEFLQVLFTGHGRRSFALDCFENRTPSF